jgi:transposase
MSGLGTCAAWSATRPGPHLHPHAHYYRHGTITLFAALNYLNGKILAERAPRHRHQEWLKFLKGIDADTQGDLDVHLILDNYATHKHPKVLAWIARHPRFNLHFSPTSSSWLNLVERFFRDLSQNVVLPGCFSRVKELSAAISEYLAERNLHPTRYVWRASGQSILEKIRKAREALARQSEISKDIIEKRH